VINLKIAFRNLIRNARRSLSIGLAIATGTVGLLCLGQFVGATLLDFQLTVVRANGHLSIFSKGYSDFGAGDPSAFGIANYEEVQKLIRSDPELGPLVQYVTPRIHLFGIASNGRSGASATFFGIGLVPEDIPQMMLWDEYGRDVNSVGDLGPDVNSNDPAAGVIGTGLARLLGLCAPLKVPDCPVLPERSVKSVASISEPPPVDLVDLAGLEVDQASEQAAAPRVDLLTATATGAPNVAGLEAVRAEAQPVQALNDGYVRLNFSFAQKLLFGDERKATAIVVQLRHGKDLPRSKELLSALFQKNGLDLEYRDLRELNPFYVQGEQFLQAIFLFFATISGVIVMFMIVNTTSANVMERVGEIGTLRALGVQRSTIRLQFALEGAMLGALGATLGVVLAQLIGFTLNALDLQITIPGNSKPGPLEFLVGPQAMPLFVGVWLVVSLVAIVAATVAAQRAAKLEIVEALRHV
jgi:putative ABC transport system permease protein